MKYFLNSEDLTGRDFSNQILEGALFAGCNLTNCDFSGSTLTYANMVGTIIEGADFSNARLFSSNFREATGTANFTNAKVTGAPAFVDFIGADTTALPPTDVPKASREKLIMSLITQSEDTFNIADLTIMQDFVDHGERGTLVGTYSLMPNGNEVYTSLGLDPTIRLDSAIVITEHMHGGTFVDDTTYKHLISL